MAPHADLLLARTEVIAFGSFRLDLRAGRLLRGREPIPLRPKTWSVLRYLAERPGVLVTKQELLDAVWADAVVSESVLSKSIGELRVALGDSFRTPRLVETVQRRGFRFIAPLSDSSASSGTGLSVEPTGGPSPDLGAPHDVPFVGRAEELRRLADLLAQAHAGRRQIVFVTGSAGIGKTALVEAFLASPAIHDRRAHGIGDSFARSRPTVNAPRGCVSRRPLDARPGRNRADSALEASSLLRIRRLQRLWWASHDVKRRWGPMSS